MLVYHGTTLEIKEPKIITTEIGRDFGFAFYTTDIKEQAERWALRRAKIQSRKSQNSVSAVVNIFDWERDIASDILEFDGASMEWLDMVVSCRSDLSYKHEHDIVLPKYRTVIFVNGCFWHGHTGCKYYVVPKTNTEFWLNKINSNIDRDVIKATQLKELGWRVITVWECELKKPVFDDTINTLIKVIKNNMSSIHGAD